MWYAPRRQEPVDNISYYRIRFCELPTYPVPITTIR